MIKQYEANVMGVISGNNQYYNHTSIHNHFNLGVHTGTVTCRYD